MIYPATSFLYCALLKVFSCSHNGPQNSAVLLMCAVRLTSLPHPPSFCFPTSRWFELLPAHVIVRLPTYDKNKLPCDIFPEREEKRKYVIEGVEGFAGSLALLIKSLLLLSFLTSVHLIFRNNSSLLSEFFAAFQSWNALILIQPRILSFLFLTSSLYELPVLY